MEPTPTPSVSASLSPQVRMAILRIIGQLALSGFQDKIKGWGLKYVSVQLTLSTYKLVSGLTWSRWTSELVCKALKKVHLSLNRHARVPMTQALRRTGNCG